MTVEFDSSGLRSGDIAGLGLVITPMLGSAREGGRRHETVDLHRFGRRRDGSGAASNAAVSTPRESSGTDLAARRLQLRHGRGHLQLERRRQTFSRLGPPFTRFQLTTFQGVRPALFNFNTSGHPGGYADFDNYSVEEPRARGIEREIPVGRTITLTSGADGSFLTAEVITNVLVSVPAEASGTIPQSAMFQIIDLGLGRVALKAANGRFVSAVEGAAVLKDLAGKPPVDAESFQWINLMRGDIMLLSVVNHRYLATRPNEPGPITISATGPRPARKGGACFKWKAVE